MICSPLQVTSHEQTRGASVVVRRTIFGALVLIVGREPGADVVLPLPQVSARHALIEADDVGWIRVRDLGSANGTFLDGRRISDSCCQWGADLRLGSVAFDWQAHGDSLRKGAGHRALLVGRDEGNDIRIPDGRVSSVHAVVVPDSSGVLRLLDLGSANGCRVNGQPVARATVWPGDAVALGSLGVDLFRLIDLRGATSRGAAEEARGAKEGPRQDLDAQPAMPSLWARLAGYIGEQPRWALVVAVLVLVIGGVLTGTLLRARSSFATLNAAAEDQLARIRGARSGWSDDQASLEANAAIEHDVARAYLETLDAAAEEVETMAERMQAGQGMLWWYGAARRASHQRWSQEIGRERQLAQSIEVAIAETASVDRRVREARDQSEQARAAAKRGLSLDADESDLLSEAAQLGETRANLSRLAESVQSESAGTNGARLALLRALSSSLDTAVGRVRVDEESLAEAASELVQYKSELRALLEQEDGLIALFDELAQVVKPTLGRVAAVARDVVRLIRKGREPAGLLLRVAPLELAMKDPKVRVLVVTTQTVCEGIEVVDREVDAIAQATGALRPSLEGFLRDGLRREMRGVHAAAPEGAAMLRRVADHAQPLSEAVGRAGRAVDDVRGLVRGLGPVGHFVGELLGGVANLIHGAGEVLEGFVSSTRRSAASFDRVVQLESDWSQRLGALRGG